MPVVLGSGEHRYRVVENWAKLPDGWNLTDVGAVAVDSKDRVYVFNRGEHPMVVLDRDGNFIKSWGEGPVPPRARAAHRRATTISTAPTTATTRCASARTDGKVLLTIGIPGRPAPYMSGEPFHRCTHTALSPQGRDLRVGRLRQCLRAQIHAGRKADQDAGASPAPIRASSTSCTTSSTDADGWVYVADRENHRVQVFDGNGKYETQWNNLHRPCALCCCGGKKPNFIIGELGPGMPVNLQVHRISGRASPSWTRKGKQIARLGGEDGPGLEAGKFLAPHGIALDSQGRHLRGRGRRHQLEDQLPGHADAEGACAVCRSWNASLKARAASKASAAAGTNAPRQSKAVLRQCGCDCAHR